MSQFMAICLVASVLTANEGRVSGVVIDDDDNPIKDARVLLLKYRLDDDECHTTQSDADGRFSFADTAVDPSQRWMVLAHKPGFAIGGVPFLSEGDRFASSRAHVPIGNATIRLRQAALTTIKVVDPDGQPVTIGRLSLMYLDVGGETVAAAKILSDNFPFELKQDGTATIDVVGEKTTFALKLNSDRFGTQQLGFLEDLTNRTAQLREVGRITGRVVAADPQAVKGLQVSITSRDKSQRVRDRRQRISNPLVFGRATVTTDEQGEFEFPTIAAGSVSVSVRTNNDLPFRSPNTGAIELAVGESTEVVIELERKVLVRVRGSVLDAETSDPVSGAIVAVGGTLVTTNENGRFETLGRPGRLSVNFKKCPGLYLPPRDLFLGVEVPADAQQHELDPIRLKKGRALAGTVVDENGKPVSDAIIYATWQNTDRGSYRLGGKIAVSREDGQFKLTPVPTDAKLQLTATTKQRASAQSLVVQPDTPAPIQLTVVPEAVAVFTGRVTDPNGKPVAKARIKLAKAARGPSGTISNHRGVLFDGQPNMVSDSEGFFRSPFPLPRQQQYRMIVEADGMSGYQSYYLTPAKEGLVRFEDVVLEYEESVSGRVVDQDGQPVADATVWSHCQEDPRLAAQRLTVQSGKEGRFRLEDLHPDARFVFAEKDGYRLRGAVIAGPEKPVEIVLPTLDAPTQPLHSIRRTADQQHRPLKRMIEPILLPMLLEPSSGYFPVEALKLLAPFDADLALDHLEALSRDSSRADLLFALGHVEDGLELTALEVNPYRKSLKYCTAADATPMAARRTEILSEALVIARRIERPDQRVVALSQIAKLLYAIGDREAARKVADGGFKLAQKLPATESSAYARGSLAESLVHFDAERAMQLVKDLSGYPLTRHSGNIAYTLANTDPAEAERFLKLIQRDNNITPYSVRVCYRMAQVDAARARRLADSLADNARAGYSTGDKAHAYGLMAMAVAREDPVRARELLGKAFAQCRSVHASSSGMYGIAVTLVRFSETIDPQRTRDYFWQTLSMHPGPATDDRRSTDKVARQHENMANLVILLGLYGEFPELRRELMEPIFNHWDKYTSRDEFDFYRQNAVFTAMALTDPDRTIAWHNRFYPKVSKEDRRLIPQPWQTIAGIFASDGDTLGKKITEDVFHLWAIENR